eukprot:1150843-Pelagomonas_calceolata.AAC.3
MLCPHMSKSARNRWLLPACAERGAGHPRRKNKSSRHNTAVRAQADSVGAFVWTQLRGFQPFVLSFAILNDTRQSLPTKCTFFLSFADYITCAHPKTIRLLASLQLNSASFREKKHHLAPS